MSGESSGSRAPRELRRLLACFNGAPARCPGRAMVALGSVLGVDGLQRSPGSMSGERLVEGRPARARASTEPRLDVRGETWLGPGNLAGPFVLQRSPGSMSGESAKAVVVGEVGHRASTEPRLDVRGEVRDGPRRDRPTSASTEPRVDARGEPERPPSSADHAARASTEPRLDVRGEWREVLQLEGRGFNGAPARCPGRAVRGAATSHAGSSFNGAPARCPGRAPMRLVRTRHPHASTEPRLDVRGESAQAPKTRLACSSASTEPRLDVRGEGTPTCSARSWPPGFNGAPARCPGRGSHAARFADSRGDGASTEPRLDVRGEPPHASRLPRLDVRESHDGLASARFNGAPARCPGRGACREPRRRSPGSMSGELRRALQRSPGSMSGESLDAEKPVTVRRGFNGAPARCPGRGGKSRQHGPAVALQRSPGSMSGESRARAGRRARAPRASTEPRLDVRGEDRPRRRVTAQLQRSPGSMSGESEGFEFRSPSRPSFNGAPARCPGRAGAKPRARPPQCATLPAEPRLDVRGEHGRSSRDRRPASTEPRLDVRGEPILVPVPTRSLLQRSPGSMSGESTVTRFLCPATIASTEPRLDVRGEGR